MQQQLQQAEERCACDEQRRTSEALLVLACIAPERVFS